jgi:hypothetical protein
MVIAGQRTDGFACDDVVAAQGRKSRSRRNPCAISDGDSDDVSNFLSKKVEDMVRRTNQQHRKHYCKKGPNFSTRDRKVLCEV